MAHTAPIRKAADEAVRALSTGNFARPGRRCAVNNRNPLLPLSFLDCRDKLCMMAMQGGTPPFSSLPKDTHRKPVGRTAMHTRFQIGAAVVTNKLLLITDSSLMLRPEALGTVVEVDKETGGLLVKFDDYPNAIGIFPEDVVAR
jgi:hypothetical protein